MHTGPKADQGLESDAAPTTASTVEALERQLGEALDGTDTQEVRFHLRQALQLVEALDE